MVYKSSRTLFSRHYFKVNGLTFVAFDELKVKYVVYWYLTPFHNLSRENYFGQILKLLQYTLSLEPFH